MDAIDLSLLLGVASLSVLLVVVVLVQVLRYAMRGPPIATVSLNQPGPFDFPLPPAQLEGPAELWIRYSVTFPSRRVWGQKRRPAFGLVLEIAVDGQKLVFGHGGTHPDGLLDFEGTTHWMTSFSTGQPTNMGRYTASVLVKRLSTCPRTLQGVVYVGNGTMLNAAELTLVKRR